MAVETEAALSNTSINWDRLDKTRFHAIGAVILTAQSAILHPMTVVKTRMQVTGTGFANMHCLPLLLNILKCDGIPGIFRGFGTSAIGSLPGRVLNLTSLELSKEMMLKSTEGLDMPETTHIAMANGVAGMVSNLVSCVYHVPLDVICQRLMVQGISGTTVYNGSYDVVHKVLSAEGFRGLYRGFGITVVTQSPVAALWWGAYSAAQHIIWRSLGYGNNAEKRPSHFEMVAVQAAAGTVAGACTSVITTPIDTIKTRLQDLSTGKVIGRGREERGLYIFEAQRIYENQRDQKPITALAISVDEIYLWHARYGRVPLLRLKIVSSKHTRVMDNYVGVKPSATNMTKTLLHEEGWKGFYRGFGPRFINMSLSGALIVTYELTKRLSMKNV